MVWASGRSIRTWVSQIFRWRIGRQWWLLAFGLPVVNLAVGNAFYVLAGGPVDLGTFPSRLVLLFVLAWGTVWGGGQEELG